MQRVDIVIAVIAAVALAGSLLGLSLYDEPEYRRWNVHVNEHEGSDGIDVEDLEGPGDSKDASWTVEQENLTSITFTVDVSSTMSARNQETVVQVEFSNPDENISSETVQLTIPQGSAAGSDSASVTIDLQELPSGARDVLAKSESEVLDSEDVNVNTTTIGTGTWTLQAAITSGGALTAPVGGQIIESETVSVDVSVLYHYYSAEVKPLQIEISPAA